MVLLRRSLLFVGALFLVLSRPMLADRDRPASSAPQEIRQSYEATAATFRHGAGEYRKVGCTATAAWAERSAAYYDCQAAKLGSGPSRTCADPGEQPECAAAKSAAPTGAAPGTAPAAAVPRSSVPLEIGFAGPVAPRVERTITMDPGPPDTPLGAPVAAGSLRELEASNTAEREAKYGGTDLLKPLAPSLVNSALDEIKRGLDEFSGDLAATTPAARVQPAALPRSSADDAASSPLPTATAPATPVDEVGGGWGNAERFGAYLQPNAAPATTLRYGSDGTPIRVPASSEDETQRGPDDLLEAAASANAAGKLGWPSMPSAKKLAGGAAYKVGEHFGTQLLDEDARERVRQGPDAGENILETDAPSRLFDRFVRKVGNLPTYVVKKFNEGLLNPALKSIYTGLDEFNRTLDIR